jgi:hypothetical protein
MRQTLIFLFFGGAMFVMAWRAGLFAAPSRNSLFAPGSRRRKTKRMISYRSSIYKQATATRFQIGHSNFHTYPFRSEHGILRR